MQTQWLVEYTTTFTAGLKMSSDSTYVRLKNCVENEKEIRQVLTSLSTTAQAKFVDQQVKSGESLLQWIADSRKFDAFKCIAEILQTEDLYKLLAIQNSNGSTIMHSAMDSGDTETVKRAAASVHATDFFKLLSIQDGKGNTALH